MASFLTINDDCLCRIISFLDDPASFHSVALSCKRVQQVINKERKSWRILPEAESSILLPGKTV